MDLWRRWRPRRPTGRAGARRAGATALALFVVTAALASLLAILSHQAWPPVLVSVLLGAPALYVAWLAVPGAISATKRSVHGRVAGRWDPVELGVHRVIGGGPMPAYVRRPHDELLRAVMDPAVAASRLVVVRGGSSTGKTRAAYEAVADRLADWRVDYPLDAGALAARLEAGIPARTVLWLGELRQYADADGGAAVLGRLADLLEGEGRLVITTMWPDQWATYIAAARAGPGAADPAGTAGRLLTRLPELTGRDLAGIHPARGGVIDVPDRFAPADLQAAARTRDPLLAEAAASAAGQDGQVTQYLAGVPDLLDRYAGPGGDPYGQAVITAAMDAARLGHASPLPAALLQDAAVGYLTGPQRATEIASWHDTALAWAAEELKGAVRALQPVPPAAGTGVVGYQVADYLDQYGRRTRQDQLGPASLWDALAVCTSDVGDLTRLGSAARSRGLYRRAAALWTTAAVTGSIDAAGRLIALLHQVSPGDAARAARWAVTHVSPDDPQDVEWLLGVLRTTGANDAIRTLAVRAAAQVSLDAPGWVGELLKALHQAGIDDAVAALAHRAAAQVSFEDPVDVAWLVGALREVGASGPIATLADRAVVQVRLDVEYPDEAAPLLQALHDAEVGAAVTALANRVATQVSPDGPRTDARLLDALRKARASDAIRTLADRAAAHAKLTYSHRVGELLEALREAGASDAIGTLGARIAQISLDDPGRVADLLTVLRQAGASEAVSVLAARAAERVSLDNPAVVADLLMATRKAGASDAVRTMLNRDPADHVSLENPGDVAWLLRELREAGANDAVGRLLNRAPADHVSLGDPRAVVRLLLALREAGASDAVRTLADRAVGQVSRPDRGGVAWLMGALDEARAGERIRSLLDPTAHASLDEPPTVAWLLNVLREAGASDAIRSLAARASLRDLVLIAGLLRKLQAAGADRELSALAIRAAAEVGLDNAWGPLLQVLRDAGAHDAATALAIRAATQISLSDDLTIAPLLRELRQAGANDVIRTLAARASIDNPHTVAWLLGALREAGASDAVRTLLNRDPADHVSLDDPRTVGMLLRAMREAGADREVTALAARAAAEVSLDNRRDVAPLLEVLAEVGASHAATVLAARAANAGMFDLFLSERPDEKPDYRFGREPDGTPSRSWRWQEPDESTSRPENKTADGSSDR